MHHPSRLPLLLKGALSLSLYILLCSTQNHPPSLSLALSLSIMSAISALLFSPNPSLPVLPPPPSPFFTLSTPLVSIYKTPTAFFSAPKPHLRLLPRRALSDREETAEASATATVAVDNAQSPDATAFVIRACNRIGLLQVITRVFKILGLRIERATVEVEGEFFVKRFLVVDSHGAKIEDLESLDRIQRALRDAIDGAADQTPAGPGTARLGSRRLAVRRAGLVPESGEGKATAERMFLLMDGFLKNDPFSLQKDILDHVEYTVARSRFSFDDFEAYQVSIGLSSFQKSALLAPFFGLLKNLISVDIFIFLDDKMNYRHYVMSQFWVGLKAKDFLPSWLLYTHNGLRHSSHIEGVWVIMG